MMPCMAKIDPVKVLQPWEPGGWDQQHHSRPTPIEKETHPKLVHAGELLPDGTRARADTNVYSISVTVDATVDGWQPSPLLLSPGEAASITAQGQWKVVGGNWNGPDGHAGIPAYGPTPSPITGAPWIPGGYLKPGAVEGCLLVQDGTGFVQAFPGLGNDTIIVTAPGRVSFVANDEPAPQPGVQHYGYADNAGTLTVTMDFATLAVDESTLLAMTVCSLLGKNVSLMDIAEARDRVSQYFRNPKGIAEYQAFLDKTSERHDRAKE